MEEILASIRRIIADDQMLPLTRTGNAPQPQAQADREPPQEQLLERPRVEAPAPAIPPQLRAQRFEREEFDAAPVVQPVIESVRAPVSELPPMPQRAEPKPPEAVIASPRPVEIEARAPVQQPAPLPAPKSEEVLLSPVAGATVSSAFDALATSMFLQNSGMVEEAVREMLRPMLRQWLDNNLPVMVERLVRSEIERVARGGRG